MSLASAPADVETAHPTEIIDWVFRTYGVDQVVTTASFEDAALVHLVNYVNPAAEIVLLDTQYLFAETEWFAEQLRQRFDLNLRIIHPLPEEVPDNLWQTDTAGCCAVRKVEPLNRSLQDRAAWITGVRRVDGPTRANAPVVTFDVGRNIAKINPLATWTDDDLALYAELHDLPANPLSERGYPSIGCWPCTRPVAPGEDKRAGRWSGETKTECGLHV